MNRPAYRAMNKDIRYGDKVLYIHPMWLQALQRESDAVEYAGEVGIVMSNKPSKGWVQVQFIVSYYRKGGTQWCKVQNLTRL